MPKVDADSDKKEFPISKFMDSSLGKGQQIDLEVNQFLAQLSQEESTKMQTETDTPQDPQNEMDDFTFIVCAHQYACLY